MMAIGDAAVRHSTAQPVDASFYCRGRHRDDLRESRVEPGRRDVALLAVSLDLRLAGELERLGASGARGRWLEATLVAFPDGRIRVEGLDVVQSGVAEGEAASFAALPGPMQGYLVPFVSVFHSPSCARALAPAAVAPSDWASVPMGSGGGDALRARAQGTPAAIAALCQRESMFPLRAPWTIMSELRATLTVASRGELGRPRVRAYVEDGRLCLGKVR